MAVHLHPMFSLVAGRNVEPPTPTLRSSQRAYPSAPVRDLGQRAIQRLAALKREEEEQNLEDLEDLKMTEEQRLLLERSFETVKFEAADLDGLKWDTPAAKRLLADWYSSQVFAIHKQYGLVPDGYPPLESDSASEEADFEPPLSSASDQTIIPDDVPDVAVEPPSPPPTARFRGAPPPLVWPPLALAPGLHERPPLLSPNEVHIPLSPGSLRRLPWHARAHPHGRRTPTYRVFSLPTRLAPPRIDRRDTARPGDSPEAKADAGGGPKPPMREPTALPHSPEAMPDSTTLGVGAPQLTSPPHRKQAPKKRVVSLPPDLPIPSPLERTLSECPEGSVSPTLGLRGRALRPRELARGAGKIASVTRVAPTKLFEVGRRLSQCLAVSPDASPSLHSGSSVHPFPHVSNEDARAPAGNTKGATNLATRLAGLKIALPPLPERTLSMWGGQVTPEDELPPPLMTRSMSAFGYSRPELLDEEDSAGEWMPGGLSPELRW
ncbi:uncharacterized protein C8Q71DRAFT_863771 [Rhodofomes roseus]|uniref:Uncharacterized protein n=1 Tax=Rhodofomes roseus TaxID=34475 RepID=A0ABQ8JXZ1_9APHY|nr:uncharacterized protein C8Q71DRAFT_863771 [Rhodofomes roseus]KAH9828707.1 hypothetical protein C8Q71DRAFT_863771 [Rhodofomes roseus]